MNLNLPSIIMLVSGLILMILVFSSFHKNNTASAQYFMGMLTAASMWSLCNGIELALFDIPVKIILSKISYIGIVSVMPLWLMFILLYCKKDKKLKKWMYAILYGIPLIHLLMVFTNEYHQLVWTRITPIQVDGSLRLIFGHGPLVYAFALYCYIIIIIGITALMGTLRSTPEVFRRQAWLVIVGSVAPWVGNIIYIFELSPMVGVDLTPIGFIITGITFLFALTHYRMFELMPVARHTLFDELIDGVLVVDEKRRIVDINSAAVKMLGAGWQNPVGRSVNDILPVLNDIPENYMDSKMMWNESIELKGMIIDARISRLYDEKTKTSGHLVVLRDITDIRKIQNQLMEAKEAAEAASIAKSQFLANMSHEIRTPMNGIIGFVDLLSSTSLNREQSDFLNEIKTATDSLLFLINDILDYSKIEAGKLQIEAIPMNLHRLVEETVALFVPLANEKGIELISHISAEVPEGVIGDPVRLKQVLSNIIGNAVKFTQIGEVAVSVKVLHEKPEDNKQDNVKLQFEIKDTGIGMNEELKQKLFQVFTQADASTTRRFGGTGLGLAISKKILDLIGGNVFVESVPDEGSSFIITLEMGKSSNKEYETQACRERLENCLVLVVDDSRINRFIFSEYLQQAGCDVLTASDGNEALDILEKLKIEGLPQIMLIDFQMPAMDGAELGKLIRMKPEFNEVRLVMATSISQKGHVGRMKEIGFSGFLSKPVKRTELVNVMSAVLGIQSDKEDKPIITKYSVYDDKKAGTGNSILLVEDMAANQKLATLMLKKLGYAVECMENGEQAVEACRNKEYGLILMDCQMPVMDGYEASKRIKKGEGKNNNTPIVAMTANAMEGDREKCIKAGMDDYITKPIKLASIEKVTGLYFK